MMCPRVHAALITLSVLALGAAIAAPARADVIFNNLGPGDSWNRSSAYVVNGPTAFGSPAPYWPAMKFTPTFEAEMTSIELPLGVNSGTNRIDVQLRTSTTNTSGQQVPTSTVLETFTFTGLPSPFSSTQTLSVGTSVLRPDLTAGATYWVVAVPGSSDTSGGWNISSPLQTGEFASSTDNGNTWVINRFGLNEIAAFQVNGDAAGAAVPEPASLTTLAVGGLAVFGYGWWRRKKVGVEPCPCGR